MNDEPNIAEQLNVNDLRASETLIEDAHRPWFVFLAARDTPGWQPFNCMFDFTRREAGRTPT